MHPGFTSNSRSEAQRYGQTNVALVVLDLTGPPQNDQIQCQLPGTEGGIHIKVVRKCFREEDAAALLRGSRRTNWAAVCYPGFRS